MSGAAAYNYVQETSRNETSQFETAIAEVFQELERKGVITIAAPYDREGGTTLYGIRQGGTHQHDYELTGRATRLSALDVEGFLAVLNIPVGFEDRAGEVEDFIRRTGAYERNVFLIMPFGSDPDLDNCRAAITSLLRGRGFNLYRADDQEYTDGLWDNICVYMLGCKYGLAIFKQVSGIPYNPNVGVEVGFMMAHTKRVLILKDVGLPRLPGDLIHRLYHAVDFADVPGVEGEVARWFDDLSTH